MLRFTPEPEKAIAVAAKLCYSALNIDELQRAIEETDYSSFVQKVIALGHHSVLEHATYTFLIEGISRAATHQLVRHRIASYSQRSQRYVREKEEFRYIIPPSLRSNPKYLLLYKDLIEAEYNLYNQMIDSGISKEDARYILPNATETKITVTMNARELRHFFRYRSCQRAQWEIRALAILMLYKVCLASPALFEKSGPACVAGPCPEGQMSCGLSSKVKEIFSSLVSFKENELLEHLNCLPFS